MAMMPGDLRAGLLDRRQRVESIAAVSHAPQLEELLREIDSALERFDAGTYGLCEACGDPIEPAGLMKNPLARLCIDHLTPAQTRELEQDLDLAARVQQELLPPRHLIEHGWELAYHYEPSGAVSGDYCDAVHPSGAADDLMVLLGDISGKGVAASMLMAHLHATVRTLAELGLRPPQIVERANRVFCDSTMASHYATLVCARLTRTGDAEICNAGHPAPLVVLAGRVTRIEAAGVPIGLFCAKEYSSILARLAPGDSLVLYTDGVTEARNPADEEYGEARLSDLVARHAHDAPEALLSSCLRHLAAFRDRAPRADDITVMVIRRIGSPGADSL